MACWNGAGRLPNDPVHLARVTKLSLKAWLRHAPVICAFFRADGAWLVHKRVSEEAAKAQRMLEASRDERRKGRQTEKPRKRTQTEPRKNLQVIPGSRGENPE